MLWLLDSYNDNRNQRLEKEVCTNPASNSDTQDHPGLLSIRAATAADVNLLNTMIHELAEYEKELEMVSLTADDLLREGFGDSPKFRALIAEWDGHPAGYAVFFGFYSTWVGRPGLFIEDVFVRSEFRRKGIGKALFAQVARIARDEGCFGLRWEVLRWNQPAIDLYKSLGVTFLEQWRSMLLTDEAFERLAESAP